jgi:poly(hydroxyalkanoate) granule-associated protein
MSKKLKGKASDKQMAERILESAQEIWLAGLAAFEQAQKEGNKAFDSLVKEGKKIEARTRELTTDFKLDSVVEEVKERAANTWNKLENLFEQRVSQALNQIGIPSDTDIQSLKQAVAALEKRVQEAARAASQGATSGKPTASASSKSSDKDDLKKITGLGRMLEKKLNGKGILHYRQIAALSDEDIEKLEADGVKLAARLRRENWIEQAKEQHFQKYDERL